MHTAHIWKHWSSLKFYLTTLNGFVHFNKMLISMQFTCRVSSVVYTDKMWDGREWILYENLHHFGEQFSSWKLKTLALLTSISLLIVCFHYDLEWIEDWNFRQGLHCQACILTANSDQYFYMNFMSHSLTLFIVYALPENIYLI